MLTRFTYSLAFAGYRDDDTFKAIATHMINDVSSYNPEDISKILLVLGDLEIHDVRFLEAVTADLVSRLDTFERNDLISIVSSFNKLGYYSK